MNAATQVFSIPELVELILLSLPCDTIHTEVSSMRSIHVAQTTSRSWYDLLRESTPIRQKLYLPTCLDGTESIAWTERRPFPPAEPNPFIPHIVLNQRSWGSAYPFDTMGSVYDFGPSRPRFWTFSLELSRAQYSRLPPPAAWRELLATSPPFTDFWYTRAFYELGSGRAPFVTHIDFNAKVPKTEQKYRVHCPSGVTLGHIVDAMTHLFEKHAAAKFVMVESLRRPAKDAPMIVDEGGPTTKMYLPGSSAEFAIAERERWKTPVHDFEDEGPRTKLYYPGLSAEGAHGWQRGQ